MPAAPQVSPAWVEGLSGYEDLCIIDVRNRGPARRLPQLPGYVPGALTLDASALLPLVEKPEVSVIEFAGIMASHGVDSQHYVVVVDEAGGECAERLVLALQRFGHTEAAVMTGGHIRWLAEGRRVEAQPKRPSPASFIARSPGHNTSAPSNASPPFQPAASISQGRSGDRMFTRPEREPQPARSTAPVRSGLE